MDISDKIRELNEKLNDLDSYVTTLDRQHSKDLWQTGESLRDIAVSIAEHYDKQEKAFFDLQKRVKDIEKTLTDHYDMIHRLQILPNVLIELHKLDQKDFDKDKYQSNFE